MRSGAQCARSTTDNAQEDRKMARIRTPGDTTDNAQEDLAQASDAAPAVAAADNELPDADQIDASTLKRALLCKQGWLCPLKTPGSDKAK